MIRRPPAWTEHAACAGLVSRDDDPWAPDIDKAAQWARARKICAACPVRLQCAKDAIATLPVTGEYAMRGGLTPTELAHVAESLNRPGRRRPRHGTRSCYMNGCRRRECKRAHAEYEHNRRLWAA